MVTPAGAGHFRVSFSAPAGVDVSLRISAADAAGGTIEDTIPRAYGVSQPKAAAPAAERSHIAPLAGPAAISTLRAACPAVLRGQMPCSALYRP